MPTGWTVARPPTGKQPELPVLAVADFGNVQPTTDTRNGPDYVLTLLQGALTPIVREDYARLSNGRYALAVGDSHTVVDPMMGQGANSASYSA